MFKLHQKTALKAFWQRYENGDFDDKCKPTFTLRERYIASRRVLAKSNFLFTMSTGNDQRNISLLFIVRCTAFFFHFRYSMWTSQETRFKNKITFVHCKYTLSAPLLVFVFPQCHLVLSLCRQIINDGNQNTHSLTHTEHNYIWYPQSTDGFYPS